MTKERNSSIELLRIISIMMIVISHYCVFGSFYGEIQIHDLPLGINRFLLEFLTLGNIGSILFILITGYFLINSNKVKFKKIARFIFQILFYSFGIYFLLIITNNKALNYIELIKSLLPISFKVYWFATAYIVLYIFHPFINKLINALDRKQHFKMNMIMFLLFSLLHMFTTNDYYGNELVQFFMFYSIGAYLSKYPNNVLNKNNNSVKLFILSLIIIIISIISFDLLGIHFSIFNNNSTYLLNRTSPIAMLFSISLFTIFSRVKNKSVGFINLISSGVFGVYLLSDNCYVRSIIWKDLFNNSYYFNKGCLIVHMLLTVMLTMFVCLIIELLRKYLFEKTFFKLLDKKIDSFQTIVEKYINNFVKND